MVGFDRGGEGFGEVRGLRIWFGFWFGRGAGIDSLVAWCRNIVSTVNMDCRLELKTIALHARNAEYNPKVCKGGL